jgi:hypothetical protein
MSLSSEDLVDLVKIIRKGALGLDIKVLADGWSLDGVDDELADDLAALVKRTGISQLKSFSVVAGGGQIQLLLSKRESVIRALEHDEMDLQARGPIHAAEDLARRRRTPLRSLPWRSIVAVSIGLVVFLIAAVFLTYNAIVIDAGT